jgi:putative heme iron utilization protein
MQPEHLDVLKELLTVQNVLALALVVDGEPVVGLLPFAASPDFGALIIQASRLARHSKGLREGARFDALVHAPATPGVDPLQIPRVTLQGRVTVLPEEGPQVDAVRRTYLGKVPSARAVAALGDFHFYRLQVEKGRLVAGFAQAVNLTADTLRRLP